MEMILLNIYMITNICLRNLSDEYSLDTIRIFSIKMNSVNDFILFYPH
jgi:hypothetical protein